ncbi:SdrD B-like domain-containing protein [Lentzea sp. HUAS TT2]|uniref:SdrD B-like domain-containing protein n=1 Tax=Lentzea sp. HUAS TT2 TaxID=3447454 RepID=UPI003F70FA5B
MKKLGAVAMTAAFVLTAVGTPALAQEEKISIGGLVWFDRDGDRKVGAEEAGLAGEKVVKITKDGELVGEYTTDDKGMYSARDLPAGKYEVTASTGGRYKNTTPYRVVTEGGTVDFGVQGRSIAGLSFYDKNLDGRPQADEERLSPGTLNGKPIAVSGEGGVFSVEDLPAGKYEFVAADYTARGLTLVEPLGTLPIDWATGRIEFTLGELEGPGPLNAVYADAKADIALEFAITPAKDVYTVGDQIDLKVTLSNKGNAPVAPTFVLGSFGAKLLSHSDNVTLSPGTDEDFSLNDKILPGKQAEVALKIELNDVTYTEVHAMARFNFGRLPDVNRRNNVAVKPIKIVEKGAETTTPPSSSTPTAAPTTTTTTDQAVAKAGNKSGLASTGASPLGFLGLGALLLAAGVGAFFVARRRRS